MHSIKTEVLQVLKLSKEAIIPKKGSPLAAGFDLSSAHDIIIPAKGKGLVKTDLSIAIPHGCYARVAPRSGLALKKFIDTGAGVIDADYRGNVGVVLFNHSENDFEVKYGDRIAQLIIERIAYPDIQVVDELSETDRGAGGFGSTGVKENSTKRPREPEHEIDAESKDGLNMHAVVEGISLMTEDKILDETRRKKLKHLVMNGDSKQQDLIKSIIQTYTLKRNKADVEEWLTVLDV